MPVGVNDAAITTNDLVKQFVPTMVEHVDAADVFAPFFKTMIKPVGIGDTVNFIVDTTADEAERQPPGAHRRSKQRSGFEVEIHIKDKIRHSEQITWEKIRKGRVDEVEAAVRSVESAMARMRSRELGSYLLTNAAQNSGTPTDPTAPSVGQTPYWWNTNDTVAPPSFGENTFAAGEDHVETGTTALTLDRLRVYMEKIVGKGYGETGLFTAIGTQEERVLLQLANVAQSSQTAGVALRDEFQASFRASGVNGLYGLQIGVSSWVPAGVVGMWDANLANLGVNGGAVRVEELALTPDMEDDKDTQSTWVEATEQYGSGILHKGAGYTAHVA